MLRLADVGVTNNRWRLDRVGYDTDGNVLYDIRQVASGRCIDVPQGYGTEGAHLWIADCHGHSAHQWTVQFTTNGYQIRNPASQKCVDFLHDSLIVVLWSCGSFAKQFWSLQASQ